MTLAPADFKGSVYSLWRCVTPKTIISEECFPASVSNFAERRGWFKRDWEPVTSGSAVGR